MANITKAERARREAEKQKAAANEQDQTPPVHQIKSGEQELPESRDLSVLPEGQETQEPAPDAVAVSYAPFCPPMSIELGDRTPEVVEWVKQYQPERFKSYYQTRWPKLYGTAE